MGLTNFLSGMFSTSDESEIWNTIKAHTDIAKIVEESENRPQLVYKHSNRCSVCFVAKGNIESAADEILDHADMHYLNVVKHRGASDEVASRCSISHESPQVIIIDDGEVTSHASHGQISGSKILQSVT